MLTQKKVIMRANMRQGLIYAGILLGLFTACQKEESTDSTAPGKVSNVLITPTNGGALIKYDLPEDDDILYVKANYTNTLGEEVFRVSSFYDNKIEVEGYNDTEEHDVRLTVYDRSGNKSESVVEKFTPLKSHIEMVKDEIVLSPDFGGIRIEWENPSEKTLFTYFSYYNEEGKEIVEILPSSEAVERFVVRGMDTSEKEFFIQVEDFWGNKTEKISKGLYSPLYEEKIDKSKWTLVSNLSIDGNAWEGRTVNLWDDVIDTKELNDDNSYAMIWRNRNGGQLNFPLDIVIDMNAMVVINRLEVWQRAFWYGNEDNYFYYQNENVKGFDLYISNDKVNWIQVGDFSIEDPKDAEGNVPAAAIQDAIDGHGFELDEYTTEFRYLKFSITENFGSEEYVNISELSLFGTQKDL